MWVDSHCHLQERYRDDDANDVAGALSRAHGAGVTGLVCVGTDASTSREAVVLAEAVARGDFGEAVPTVRAVVGLHPHESTSSTTPISELLLTKNPHIAGVGECGIDLYYEHSPRAAQRTAFATQIGFAHAFELPLVIHARDAWDDLFDVLEVEGVPKNTVLHCFTGGPAEAERCLEAGMTISFSGIITFPKAPELREAAALVPLDRLLIETDSPFLAPVPHRGKPNEPSLVALVGVTVAAAHGVEPSVVATASSNNARRIFAF
jgi:TatD DNase family protein